MSAAIPTWTLCFETLSPAFVGGARPNDRAELRVPSILGAWRAWYRLLLGPEVAAGLPEAVPDARRRALLAESSLFGGAGGAHGQGRLVLSLTERVSAGTERWDIRSLRRSQPGLAYLGFSLKMGDNDRKALAAGSRFGLRTTFPRGLDPLQADLLLATVWAWSWLGGMGSRSRRGFGAVAPTRWPPDFQDARGRPAEPPDLAKKLPDPGEATDLGSFTRELANGLFAIDDLVKAYRSSPGEPAPPKAVYRLDKSSRFAVWGGADGRGWSSWNGALDAVGRKLSEFRKQRGIDGWNRSTLKMLQSRARLPHAPHRAAFGLPLAYRDVKNRGPLFVLVPQVAGREAERMPSPLLIRPVHCQGGWFVVLTLLSGSWPGRELAVEVQHSARGYFPEDPANDLPRRFMRSLPGRKEIEL